MTKYSEVADVTLPLDGSERFGITDTKNTNIDAGVTIQQLAEYINPMNKQRYDDGVDAITDSALFTTGDVSNFTTGTISISGLTGETVRIEGEINDISAGDINVRNSSGNVVAASALGNGTYSIGSDIPLSVDKLNFIKSSTVESATVNMRLVP